MKVIFVVGTTASGKSDLSLRLAQKFSGAIVNCDSVQLFKGLDVGSAKPSQEDFQKAPHFLFDIKGLGDSMTAGEYTRVFFECLDELNNQYKAVFVVGGTGFYFQAIEKGMYSIGAANREMKEKVEAELAENGGPEKLHHELANADPESAIKISVNDHYRLGRAIEVLRTHRKPLSEIKKEFEAKVAPFPYPLLKLGLAPAKEDLLPFVEKRTDQMLANGLTAEVQSLLAKGLGTWAALSSVGYYETIQHLEGKIGFLSRQELRDKIIQNTMKLAKKQRTWFRRDKEINWLARNDIDAAARLVSDFLAE